MQTKIGDILIERVNGEDIKICDFGLAQRIIPGRDLRLEYGHPEFVAPEIVNKQNVTLAADMWSVGIITYILLSGTSPFLGENDRETLERIKSGNISFSDDAFSKVSDEAKDFLSKLLVFEPSGRLNVKQALHHNWIKNFRKSRESVPILSLDNLKDYHQKWQQWVSN